MTKPRPEQLNEDFLIEDEHDNRDHSGIPGVGLTEDEHDNRDHSEVPGVGASLIGGTGSAGSVTYSANQTVDGVVEATSITIDNGVTLTHSNERLMWLKSQGNITNNGTINTDGKGMAGGGTSGASVDHMEGKYGCSYGGAGGGDNSFATPDGDIEADISGWTPRLAMFGGSRTSRDGPDVQTFVQPEDRPAWVTDIVAWPIPVAPGGGGSGGGITSGGRGGGCVVLEARGDVDEGTISLNGADGSQGQSDDDYGGGGGGGGMLAVCYGGTNTTGTVSVAAGAGGAGTGTGEDGRSGEVGLIRRIKVPV